MVELWIKVMAEGEKERGRRKKEGETERERERLNQKPSFWHERLDLL